MSARLASLFLGLALPLSLSAQTAPCPQILDEAGQPLPGATLRLVGSYWAQSSDGDGRVCLPHKLSDSARIEVSFMGYRNVQILASELLAQPLQMQKQAEQLDEFVLQGVRLDPSAPMAFENIGKEELNRNNLGMDLPMLLENSPSVVVTSDAGAGVGYTGLRIRGSDPTRINVSINGVPLNDAESQGVFWVNMPDFASSVQTVQVQRGVGSSAQGAGSFGAGINLQTNSVNTQPYLQLSNSIGSFATRKHSLMAGTGLINKHWSADVRLSEIASDGYVDRAASKLRSYYASAAWLGAKSMVRAMVFSGKEETYQAWGGIPAAWLDSLPTYNPYTYENEIDDYQQTHYQLHYTQELGNQFVFNLSPHYTRGKGFYEQYKAEQDFSKYNLAQPVIGNDTLETTDLIRRRWLDNHFYGFVYGLHYRQAKHRLSLGGGWNRYWGKHFGEVIWAQFASNGAIRHRYYDNLGQKLDGNTYLKWQYSQGANFWFLDLQHRFVDYQFLGFDNNLNNVSQAVQYHFFNPKLGWSRILSTGQRVYASMALANREPNRDDLTQSSPESRPKPEQLYDLETGFEHLAENWQVKANVYGMYYRNQLVLNGQINDVGAFIRTNVPESYRLGLELQGLWSLPFGLEVRANATLSQNKIMEYTEYVDDWDTWGQVAVTHKNKDLAFSPKLLANVDLRYRAPWLQGLELAWVHRYVGRQYLDNSQDAVRSLNPYLLSDLRLAYSLQTPWFKRAELSFLVRNLYNKRYASNGWVYRFQSAGYDPRPDDAYASADAQQANMYQQIGLYPQAGINFFLGLTLDF